MTTIALATCSTRPGVQPDDIHLAEALAARGVEVVAAAWNGPFEPFAGADLVVVRSTWDCHLDPPAFAAWLEALAALRTPVHNQPKLMRWNADKRYLLDLAERGAPLPPTRLVTPEVTAIAVAMRELALDQAVVKPVFGAGGDGLSVVALDDAEGLARAATALGGDGLVQPVLREIQQAGECSLVFFGGLFSHAVRKVPAPSSLLVHEEHGGRTERFDARPTLRRVAYDVMAMLPLAPTYARVDLVDVATGPLLMEVEVIEPELFFRLADGAASRLVDLLLASLPRD